MPTYLYVCEAEGHPYEEVRGMTENQKQLTCAEPGCDAKLVRKFTAPSIEFKGTGFNATRG